MVCWHSKDVMDSETHTNPQAAIDEALNLNSCLCYQTPARLHCTCDQEDDILQPKQIDIIAYFNKDMKAIIFHRSTGAANENQVHHLAALAFVQHFFLVSKVHKHKKISLITPASSYYAVDQPAFFLITRLILNHCPTCKYQNCRSLSGFYSCSWWGPDCITPCPCLSPPSLMVRPCCTRLPKLTQNMIHYYSSHCKTKYFPRPGMSWLLPKHDQKWTTFGGHKHMKMLCRWNKAFYELRGILAFASETKLCKKPPKIATYIIPSPCPSSQRSKCSIYPLVVESEKHIKRHWFS